MYAALINRSTGDRPDIMAIIIQLCRCGAKNQCFAKIGCEQLTKEV